MKIAFLYISMFSEGARENWDGWQAMFGLWAISQERLH